MRYYTVPEVAQMLRVSKSYVYDIILRGELKSIRLSERRTRISEEALLEFTERINLGYNKDVQLPRTRRGETINGIAN